MKTYLAKMRGTAVPPPAPPPNHIFWSMSGAMIGIAAAGFLSVSFNVPLLVAPFCATCVLAFGLPESPLSQPRSIIGGHLISAAIGIAIASLFGTAWWAVAIAVGLALAAMQLTRTVHAPAGAMAALAVLSNPTWMFLLFPVLAGAVLIVTVAVIFNNLIEGRAYPKYWR
ncbi:MAG: HPP family protein [Rhizobacter sp.]|nr:HPP family protein [Chlorobiales bacterium]